MREVWIRNFAGLSLTLALFAAASGALADPLRNRPRFVGSAAVFPFALEVARRTTTDGMHAIGDATGAAGGFALFCAGNGTAHPDLALAGRDMQDDERARCDARGIADIWRGTIGHGGLVAVMRGDAKPLSLTALQLWLALAKDVPGDDDAFRVNTYRRWSEIDPSLPDMPIDVVIPSSDAGRFESFTNLVLVRGCEQAAMVQQIADRALRRRFCGRMRADQVTSRTNDASERTDMMLGDSTGRIVIADYFNYNRHREAARPVAIDGVLPTPDTIANGSYALAQPLLVFLKPAQLDQINGLEAYLRALFSEEAIGDAGYLAPLGLVPLPPAERARQREALSSLITRARRP